MDTSLFILTVCFIVGNVHSHPTKTKELRNGGAVPLDVRFECAGIDNATGSVSSPGYNSGDPYPPNTYCRYLIGYNNDQHYASIIFTDFYTENYFDSVTIRSDKIDGPIIGTYSGYLVNNLPQAASPTRLFMEFVTDSSVQYRGWTADYNQGFGETCNQYISGGQGIIQSENYPSNYPNNLDCSYILGDMGDQVTIYFQDFYTEAGYDFVRIYAGSLNGELIAQLDGTEGQCKEYSYFGRLIVNFSSDSSITRSGWWAQYSIGDTAVQLCDSYSTSAPATTTTKAPDATMGDEMLGDDY